jgi:hypothetical protein
MLFANRSRGAPEAPWEIREEVEKYAREYGKTGAVEFAVGPNVWLIKLSLRPNDPRMQAWQEGRAEEPPMEVVVLQEPNPAFVPGGRASPFRALDILQMGPSGVRTFLERGNTFSGRGEFKSIEESTKVALERDQAAREAFRLEQKAANRDERMAERRSRLKIPFLPVGIDLKGTK